MLSSNLQGLIAEVVGLGIMNDTLKDQAILDDQIVSEKEKEIAALQTKLASSNLPTVFDHLESNPWLLAGGTAANSPGGTGTATATQTKPGVQSATVAIVPAAPYADKYFYQTLGAHPELTRFRQEGSFLFPTTGDALAPQAIEFDLQQVLGGVVYNWGVQFDYGEGMLRVWDRGGKTWVPTGVTLPRMSPGVWAQCSWEIHREAEKVVYDKLVVNGASLLLAPKGIPALEMSFPTPTLGLGDMLNYGFQLDGGKVPQAFTVTQDNFRLTGWKT